MQCLKIILGAEPISTYFTYKKFCKLGNDVDLDMDGLGWVLYELLSITVQRYAWLPWPYLSSSSTILKCQPLTKCMEPVVLVTGMSHVASAICPFINLNYSVVNDKVSPEQ
jgi:hypothetical protein